MKNQLSNKISGSSDGSAIAEFLIFTLPFFTVFLLLITQIHGKSISWLESNNLARQSVRAFITSPNQEFAMARAYQVIEIYKSMQTHHNGQSRPINLIITCQSYPCFSPGNKVSATVSIGSLSKSTASEYVDLWR